MGTRGKERVEALFSWQSVIGRYEELWNKLLRKGKACKRASRSRAFGSLNYAASPKEMQLRIRNEAAQRMLCADIRKIDSIASELGYADLGAFSKFFHKQNGISPMEYRKECQRKQPPDAQFEQ